MKIFLSLTVLFTLLLLSCSFPSSPPTRWYTPEQASAGKPLYATHCAGCHGENGEGEKNWDKPLPDGTYPAQPLNGSAHSWHHSLDQLDETIAKGGARFGGTMPGFADVLTEKERKAVIAAFQSFWSDQVYWGWLMRGGLDR